MTLPRHGPKLVFDIFAGTGAAYDKLVDVATRGEDRRWKAALLATLDGPRRVLDLACGTGILSFLLRDRFPECEVVGVDLQEEFLAVARRRAGERGETRMTFVTGSAEEAQVSGRFDAVVSCYLPKYADLPRLVPRLAAWLEEGEPVAMQDFVHPRHPAVRSVWERQFGQLVEWAEANCPEARQMFELLPELVRSSHWTEELRDELARHRFRDIRLELLSGGAAALVTARRGRDADRPYLGAASPSVQT